MQIELKKIQKKLGITFIYVTHDQDEALTMSDRIVIIDKGIIQQIDTPQNIYRNPRTTFVADFIGESNIMSGEVISLNDNVVTLRVADSIFFTIARDQSDKIGKKIFVMIRPENIQVSVNSTESNIRGVIRDVVYDGAITKLFIDVDGEFNLKVTTTGNINLLENQIVYLIISQDSIVPIRGNKYEKK